jgi:mannosyltransferase
VMFLVFLGYLALDRALAPAGPTVWSLVSLGLVSGLLLLTHYWSIYLLVCVGALLLAKAALAGRAERRRYLWAAGAVAAGGVLFVPWLPTFVYQNAHTGTPWAYPPTFSDTINAVSEFAGSRSSAGRALGLTFFALALLGLMGAGLDSRSIVLDLRTRVAGRGVALITGSTLLLAMAAGLVTHGAFAARYIAVVFPPFLLLVALGTRAFIDRRVLAVVVGAAVVFGLASSTENVRARKTQAPQVAAVLKAGVRPGDIIAYCPDQLGPSVSRMLPAGLTQLTFPRLTGPRYVDWVDYERVNKFDDPGTFSALLDRMAGKHHTLWLVWSSGYRTYGATCETMAKDLEYYRPGVDQVVTADAAKYFEHATLTKYPPAPAP